MGDNNPLNWVVNKWGDAMHFFSNVEDKQFEKGNNPTSVATGALSYGMGDIAIAGVQAMTDENGVRINDPRLIEFIKTNDARSLYGMTLDDNPEADDIVTSPTDKSGIPVIMTPEGTYNAETGDEIDVGNYQGFAISEKNKDINIAGAGTNVKANKAILDALNAGLITIDDVKDGTWEEKIKSSQSPFGEGTDILSWLQELLGQNTESAVGDLPMESNMDLNAELNPIQMLAMKVKTLNPQAGQELWGMAHLPIEQIMEIYTFRYDICLATNTRERRNNRYGMGLPSKVPQNFRQKKGKSRVSSRYPKRY